MAETLEILEIGENGNTEIHSPPTKKQSTQYLSLCFTYNNYPIGAIETIETTFRQFKKTKKFVFQEEVCPKTGTPHLQGAIWFASKTRHEELKLDKKVHWEKMRNSDASEKYCQKSETSLAGSKPHVYGFPKPLKIIEALYPWQKEIEDLFKTEPDDRKVYWFWEEFGNVGKSAFVKYMVVKHGCLFCDGGKKSDLINLVFNNDMDNCKCIIWDIPRSAKGHVSYSTLESIKNGLICNTKYETGVKAFNAPHIFVFANFPPDDVSQLSADRWVIKQID